MATARKSSSRRRSSSSSQSKTRSQSGSHKKSSSGHRSSASSRRKYGPKAKKKMSKVMHEYKHGKLKSGGRRKVKSRKQAVAIGLSEARRSGAKVPARKKAA